MKDDFGGFAEGIRRWKKQITQITEIGNHRKIQRGCFLGNSHICVQPKQNMTTYSWQYSAPPATVSRSWLGYGNTVTLGSALPKDLRKPRNTRNLQRRTDRRGLPPGEDTQRQSRRHRRPPPPSVQAAPTCSPFSFFLSLSLSHTHPHSTPHKLEKNKTTHETADGTTTYNITRFHHTREDKKKTRGGPTERENQLTQN